MTYSAWTKEDDDALISLHGEGKKFAEIASIIGRGVGGVKQRAYKIVKMKKRAKSWLRKDSKPRCNLRVREIAERVRRHFGIPEEEFYGDYRARTVSIPRQIAMLLVLDFTNISLPAIGQVFHRDHTTIIHAERSIKAKIDRDPDLRATVEVLRGVIAGACAVLDAERSGEAAWNAFERMGA